MRQRVEHNRNNSTEIHTRETTTWKQRESLEAVIDTKYDNTK
jgi:hypothetical protein